MHQHDIFGVLPVNKPSGLTSRDVVNRVQKLIRPLKIGHTGTLDPMASGVLLLAIGPATRLVEFSHRMKKSYQADFLLGLTSDTLDTDGPVQACGEMVEIQASQWQAEMKNWLGKIQQRPPRFSAVHVNGRRAHELARQGVDFEIPAREVCIYQLELLRFQYPQVNLSIECSTGTYVRCLGVDIAQALGTSAVMSRLVRTAIGPFTLESCSTLEELSDRNAVARNVRPPLEMLPNMPIIILSDQQCRQLQYGQTITAEPGQEMQIGDITEPIAGVNSAGKLFAVLYHEASGRLRSSRVFVQE